ncbi:cathepsin L [Sarracenia purpurea var. burkii]
MGLTLQTKLVLGSLLVLGLWAPQSVSRSLHEASISERYERWISRHGRVYTDSAEKERRFEIFKYNVELIDTFNVGGNQSYKLSINEFADLTNEEFRAYRNGYKISSSLPRPAKTTPFRYENVTGVPTKVDWRRKGAVTPGIGDKQGLCALAMDASYLMV